MPPATATANYQQTQQVITNPTPTTFNYQQVQQVISNPAPATVNYQQSQQIILNPAPATANQQTQQAITNPSRIVNVNHPPILSVTTLNGTKVAITNGSITPTNQVFSNQQVTNYDEEIANNPQIKVIPPIINRRTSSIDGPINSAAASPCSTTSSATISSIHRSVSSVNKASAANNTEFIDLTASDESNSEMDKPEKQMETNDQDTGLPNQETPISEVQIKSEPKEDLNQLHKYLQICGHLDRVYCVTFDRRDEFIITVRIKNLFALFISFYMFMENIGFR
jgi:hypothetical protein